MLKKLKNSPINYFSDLFIVSMVLIWIFFNIFASLIAASVTISSIVLSFTTQEACFDTSLWDIVRASVEVPLTAGGAIWMVKCSLQHYLKNKDGEECPADLESEDTEEED